MKRYTMHATHGNEVDEEECIDGEWVRFKDADQLRGNLSLAEEGLANYAQENARLQQEIEVLRLYGNKDCTHMADAELERRRALPQSERIAPHNEKV